MHADAPSLAERLALIIEALCAAVARRVGPGFLGGLAGPLIILIRARLRRIAARFTRLAAQPGRPIRAACRPSRPVPADPFPALRRFASLLRLVPETAALASQLRHLLADPRMKALLQSTPELGRTLRPLCRMLGIRAAKSPPPSPPGHTIPSREQPAHPIPPRLPPPILLQAPA
ncbi:MAG TPA: hypothetical protein VFN77_08865 [Acetobacteraceae bacterium]|nr:hypothetical protein [Acetobacteraceae bacterium]